MDNVINARTFKQFITTIYYKTERFSIVYSFMTKFQLLEFRKLSDRFSWVILFSITSTWSWTKQTNSFQIIIIKKRDICVSNSNAFGNGLYVKGLCSHYCVINVMKVGWELFFISNDFFSNIRPKFQPGYWYTGIRKMSSWKLPIYNITFSTSPTFITITDE